MTLKENAAPQIGSDTLLSHAKSNRKDSDRETPPHSKGPKTAERSSVSPIKEQSDGPPHKTPRILTQIFLRQSGMSLTSVSLFRCQNPPPAFFSGTLHQ